MRFFRQIRYALLMLPSLSSPRVTNLPLKGAAFAVTRPSAQAAGLLSAIQAAGGVGLLFPLLGIAPILSEQDLRALNDVCERLSAYDIAFFVSVNAVQFGMAAALKAGPWPSHVMVSTVGASSEAALRAYGFGDVIAPQLAFDTEAVLDLPAFAPERIRGKRVLIFRGNGGRDLLAEVLRARGAQVDCVSCYLRQPGQPDVSALLAYLHKKQLKGVILTSSEAVRYMPQALGAAFDAVRQQVPAFAPHPRIITQAKALGFMHCIQTQIGDAGIVQGLIQAQR